MFLLIVGFVIGVYAGYKYPQQVEQVMNSGKSLFNDLKEKISKKSS